MLKLYATMFADLRVMGELTALSIASDCKDTDMIAAIERLIDGDEDIPAPTCTHAFIATAKLHGESKEGDLELYYHRADDGFTASLFHAREHVAMWAVAPCSGVNLSKTAQSEVVDTYNYEWRQERVRARMEEMLTNFGSDVKVDLHADETKTVIENIESDITKNVDKYGCDEDWSLEEAMKEHDFEVRAILRIFEKGDEVHIVEAIGCHSITGIVTDADETEVTVKRADTGEEESVYLTHIANARIYI